MEYRSTPTACNSPILLSHSLLEINAPASSASDSYSSSSDSDYYRIEQDLLWRKEKNTICLPWLSHMIMFLLKIQLEELDRVEVAKKLEVERHLKFFNGNITAAFADLDNAIMEVGRTDASKAQDLVIGTTNSAVVEVVDTSKDLSQALQEKGTILFLISLLLDSCVPVVVFYFCAPLTLGST